MAAKRTSKPPPDAALQMIARGARVALTDPTGAPVTVYTSEPKDLRAFSKGGLEYSGWAIELSHLGGCCALVGPPDKLDAFATAAGLEVYQVRIADGRTAGLFKVVGDAAISAMLAMPRNGHGLLIDGLELMARGALQLPDQNWGTERIKPAPVEALRALARIQGTQPINRLAAKLVNGNDAEMMLRQTLNETWLIHNIWPDAAGLLLMYGRYGTYKSFIALDMALCLATGKDYHGHKTIKKKVCYVSAEGTSGIWKRVVAWQKYHGVTDISGLVILPSTVILNDATAMQDLIGALVEHNPDIIVVDTLSRSMAGNENSTEDMAEYVRCCDHIRDALECALAIVHHAGKDSDRGPRGSIVLPSGVDVEWLISVPKDWKRCCVLECTKQKDYDKHAPMVFDMDITPTGYVDSANNVVDSLVPRYNPDATWPPGKAKKTISPVMSAALTALNQAAKETGINAVTKDQWRGKFYAIEGDKTAATKRQNFNRAIIELKDNGLIMFTDGCFTSVTVT